MAKEVHIDIGGSKRADFFVGKAAVDKDRLYLVLDPRRFRCHYVNIYPNLQLMRWTATEEWDLPFADESIDNANLNFIYDYVGKLYDRNDAYRPLIHSLRRVIKPLGHVFIREPRGYMEILIEMLQQEKFHVEGPKQIDEGAQTPAFSIFHGYAQKDEKPEDSAYFPLELIATPN